MHLLSAEGCDHDVVGWRARIRRDVLKNPDASVAAVLDTITFDAHSFRASDINAAAKGYFLDFISLDARSGAAILCLGEDHSIACRDGGWKIAVKGEIDGSVERGRTGTGRALRDDRSASQFLSRRGIDKVYGGAIRKASIKAALHRELPWSTLTDFGGEIDGVDGQGIIESASDEAVANVIVRPAQNEVNTVGVRGDQIKTPEVLSSCEK